MKYSRFIGDRHPERMATHLATKKSVQKSLSSMIFVRHAQIDDGQHHKDEGLESDDEEMKNRPRPAKGELNPPRQQGDQDEDQLSSVQVAKKPQA